MYLNIYWIKNKLKGKIKIMHNLKNKRILVTGGAGFIGSHIVDALIKEKPKQIIVFDNFIRGTKNNLKEALKSKKVKIIKGDITNQKQLNLAMKNIDYVFHEAALWLLNCEENPREAIRVNIEGTFNVLEACIKNHVKKIVAASSSSVYGDGIYFPTDEIHPFNNYLFYGATKVANEQFYRAYWKKHGLDYIAFRYLNVYGPRQDYRSAYISAIMNFINKIDKREAPIIKGDGTATMDLIYVGDVADANILALKSDVSNECFNAASGRETTVKQLLDILVDLMGTKNIKPIYEARDKKLVSRRFGCPKKAKKMLGFVAKTSVKDGMKKVIEWRNKEVKKIPVK